MNATTPLFEVPDAVVARPACSVAHLLAVATEDDLTGIAGVSQWGELLDRIGLVAEADRRDLRPIAPGGYTGGECYRALVETMLAGGDFISDRSLLDGEATRALRGQHALPSTTTLWRFLAGAGLGRVKKAEAVNQTMLRRAWAMGAGPSPGLGAIDPDATYVSTYGRGKERSRFSYKGEVQMSPLVGVLGETGDVLALRARSGNASPRKKLASFIDECVGATGEPWRSKRQLWIRIDSAGFSRAVIDRCIAHNAAFSITCIQGKKVREAIYALASNPETTWGSAKDADGEIEGSEIAETAYRFGGRTLRMIVRRQKKAKGTAQL